MNFVFANTAHCDFGGTIYERTDILGASILSDPKADLLGRKHSYADGLEHTRVDGN